MITSAEVFAKLLSNTHIYTSQLHRWYGENWQEPMQSLIDLGLVSEYQYITGKTYRALGIKRIGIACRGSRGMRSQPYQSVQPQRIINRKETNNAATSAESRRREARVG